jgi:superfamily I DNA and/or RNA helicase
MQVNLLKKVLPNSTRVGTVDKFQGQEAEVVFVSLATSSQDKLPRNFDFLYSRNRLNVAISRAKTKAILVFSPKLLTVNCNKTEDMKLVNVLCQAVEYSEKVEVN